jgi:hypothetical protein
MQITTLGAGQIGRQLLGQTLTGFAIRVCFGAGRAVAIDTQEGQQTGYSRPTGLVRHKNLVQKSPDRHQRRVKAFTEADMMSLYRCFDLLFWQQLSHTQVLIFQKLLPTLLNAAYLTILSSLGILVHDRPPC